MASLLRVAYPKERDKNALEEAKMAVVDCPSIAICVVRSTGRSLLHVGEPARS